VSQRSRSIMCGGGRSSNRRGSITIIFIIDAFGGIIYFDRLGIIIAFGFTFMYSGVIIRCRVRNIYEASRRSVHIVKNCGGEGGSSASPSSGKCISIRIEVSRGGEGGCPSPSMSRRCGGEGGSSSPSRCAI